MTEQKSEKKVVSRTVAIALGIICIVLAVSLVGAIADYTSMINSKDNIISSQTSSSLASLKEPPALTTKINGTASLKNDLESLGCEIINSTNWSNTCGLENYADFRRIAYNTGVVFWYDTGAVTYYSEVYDSVTLYTIFGSSIFSFSITFYLVT
jgi:hypothetical protein